MIAVMKLLIGRSIEQDQELFVSFVDFEKAFDRFNWANLVEFLKLLEWIGEMEN